MFFEQIFINKACFRLFVFILVTILLKIAVFCMYPTGLPGVLGDADQYHAYALGLDDRAYSLWSWLLRWLADHGWYSRDGVIFCLLMANALVIPVLAAFAVMSFNGGKFDEVLIGWIVASLLGLYPTLYFYSLDVYRDVLMMVAFLLGLICVRQTLDQRLLIMTRGFWCLLCLSCAWVLYLLRPYLGAAFLVALPGAYLFDFSRARLCWWAGVWLLCLNLVFMSGVLDPIAVVYRGLFDGIDADTTLGIGFDSPWTFLPKFIQSWIYQLMGIFFPTPMSWLPFFLESVPFMIASYWLICNRRYADRYVSFLVVFFIAYATIWVLGNDNLGTAVRLRMFNYVAVLVACGVVLIRRRACRRQMSCE